MELNIREALRYLGVRGEAPENVYQEAERAADELKQRFPPRWVWRVATIERCSDGLMLQGTGVVLSGSTAAKMLADCDRCAMLACTLGIGCEAWMRGIQSRSMARAVMLDALGSAWVEAGCDAAEAEIRAHVPGTYLTDRFSPGYGDLPLDVQPALLEALDAQRRLGVYETSAHMMAPQKSVTALIGLSPRPQAARVRGCAHCAMNKTCTLRKAGMPCDI